MDLIDELLTRGVEKIYPSKEELDKVLQSGKKLRLYQGFDPTGDKLHIGHMVGLMKLRQWQKRGHHVIFLIGDGTGQAGDPSGKTTSRERFFTRDELRKNATDYVKQASKIVQFKGENAVEVLFNGDWLNKLSLVDILEIAGHFSWQQLAERDLFQERIKRGETLNLREALYPLLQGYDSVAMDVDLEVGGTDQTFNMLCGRTLMKAMKNKDKFVMTTPLLTDSSGKKIGKSEGNVIALTDKPADLFGKVMSFPDEVIVQCFECLTEIPMGEIQRIESDLKKGENPMKYKKQLAFTLTAMLNNNKDAEEAQEHFEKTVQRREIPEDIATVHISTEGRMAIRVVDLLEKGGLVSSRAEAKRMVKQGAVEVNENEVADPNQTISVKDGMIVRVGKRKYVKILISS